ncbi:MAG TPA: bacterial transcriptional activator domain-containing protein [Burkholderiales bacterium]|nr:bacterial transcriptional activator domain-containing protein [Burkholderiales bacterium]
MYAAPEVVGREGCSSAPDKSGRFDRAGSAPEGEVERADRLLPIRIYTLGRFSVAIDGQPVCSNGKGQQRPFGLLKALIALGGREVAASRLWECLWPDSEGDLGVRNLTITVHRLRRQLRCHAAILQHDGKLSLNDRVCWVDTWHFERLANEALHSLEENVQKKDAEPKARAALALYGGHFLARESEESWMLSLRLRLETRFERLVAAWSEHLEEHARFGQSVDVCRAALEQDPLNESLYRRLMSCYLKAGELAEVVRMYRRCWEALSKGLGAQPSEETQRLYLEGLQAAALRTGHAPVHQHRHLRAESAAVPEEGDASSG